MKKLVLFLILTTGCASGPVNIVDNLACGKGLFDPEIRTVKEFDCIVSRRNGKMNFDKDAEQIRANLVFVQEQKKKIQFEKKLNDIQIISTVRDPKSAVIEAPSRLGHEYSEAKMLQFCDDYGGYRVTATEQVKKYVGNKGKGSAFCSHGWCSDSSSSVAIYDYAVKISFVCVK